MVSNAVSLAVLTTAGAVVIYNKLPRKVRRFLKKYSLLTDVFAMLAVYSVMGSTVTALFASALCGLMISVMLHIANNPDDFLYLYDLKDYIKEKLNEVKGVINEYGREYREGKLKGVDAQVVVEA